MASRSRILRTVGAGAAACVVALSVIACGSKSHDSTSGSATTATTTTPQTSPSSTAPIPPALPGTVPAGAAKVIQAWADALRAGHVSKAAGYFAVPTVVANGGTPLRLTSPRAIFVFNDSLPCGAVLTRTDRGPHGFVIATFRLTERPGPGVCGGGVGDMARTAFRIRDGHIDYWLRVADGTGRLNPRTTPQPTPTNPTRTVVPA